MALLKEHINDCGIVTNYHKISYVSFHDNRLDCTISSYASKAYRDCARHADTLHFCFDITVEEEESMGIRALCYTKIKELENWSDATDC